jgi:hypothetical protein
MQASQSTYIDLTLDLDLCLFPLCLLELEPDKYQCYENDISYDTEWNQANTA